MPADNTPANNMPANNMPADNMPAKDMPVKPEPVQDVPLSGVPVTIWSGKLVGLSSNVDPVTLVDIVEKQRAMEVCDTKFLLLIVCLEQSQLLTRSICLFSDTTSSRARPSLETIHNRLASSSFSALWPCGSLCSHSCSNGTRSCFRILSCAQQHPAYPHTWPICYASMGLALEQQLVNELACVGNHPLLGVHVDGKLWHKMKDGPLVADGYVWRSIGCNYLGDLSLPYT